MSSDNKQVNIDVQEPLLEHSGKKPATQIENLPKNDAETNNKHKSSDMERKRTKSVAIIAEKDEKKMDKWKLVPPDGGWGWLVLFGSTLVNVLVPGTVKSFGVLKVEFEDALNATPDDAAWVAAICYFLYSSLGPLSSILSVKYSYRTVTLIGGTFAAAGMILSFFANSVAYLCISYGVLVGTGAGLSFPPTVYIVTSYFVRLRGLANGLCISGSALGSIILPPVLDLLLGIYGYRGAVLLMGGVTLNVWVAALFYDPVEKHMKKVPIEPKDSESEEASPLKPKFVISTEDSMASLQHIPHNDSFLENLDISSNNFNRSVSSAAMQNFKAPTSRERKISMPTGRNELMKAGTGSRTNMNSSSALHAVPESGNGAMQSQGRLTSSRRIRVPKRSPSTSSFQYVSTPYHGSTLTLQPETFASSFSLKSVKKTDGKEPPVKKNKFFDISLLKDPLYLVILISNATNAVSYTNFIILLPSFAKELGYNMTMGALLLSIVSALDLVGRIGGSALSDLHLCPKAAYFIGGLLVSGISLGIMPFFTGYGMISFFCAVFGLASGIYVGVTAVIMADMLGEERLQSTYGISLFVNGILQLVGPPLCGIWFEQTKSFVSLFCILGVILVVGASIWVFVPFIRKPRSEDSDDDDEDSS
ncbi:monocarboxylate transporter 9 [Tribolium castaneum]|uniref:Monocarboxylate transporter 9-like Protein n=1 Tax=Tribolium castaneum TaxID=7070 RepID=D6W748_TRICA|nr:PREDICTED: monocarboxylate transporter 9 [Tribolium castaneum]EFA11506.1 Monocarboxylate transporter 9-like Protein [Tribolium castaneum]|eukprot:XP_001814361.1 PREDICTED: monocarboxylate transporter 9 [Tribolium castaneum]